MTPDCWLLRGWPEHNVPSWNIYHTLLKRYLNTIWINYSTVMLLCVKCQKPTRSPTNVLLSFQCSTGFSHKSATSWPPGIKAVYAQPFLKERDYVALPQNTQGFAFSQAFITWKHQVVEQSQSTYFIMHFLSLVFVQCIYKFGFIVTTQLSHERVMHLNCVCILGVDEICQNWRAY